MHVTRDATQASTAGQLRGQLYREFIRETYERLSNHSVLAIQIRPFREGEEDGQWRLFSDLVLYAEKHREVRLKAGYFHPAKVEAATGRNHIRALTSSGLDSMSPTRAFSSATAPPPPRPASTDMQPVVRPGRLAAPIRQERARRNGHPLPGVPQQQRGGRLLPRPGRPELGMPEPYLPGAKRFDRGNHYSLASIIKQEAIKSEADQIPEWSLKRWKLDVVRHVGADVADMLVPALQPPWRRRRLRQRRQADRPAARPPHHARGVPADGGRRGHVCPVPVVGTLSARRRAGTTIPRAPRTFLAGSKAWCCITATALRSLGPGRVVRRRRGHVTAVLQRAKLFHLAQHLLLPVRHVQCGTGGIPGAQAGSYYVFNIFDYFDNENSLVFSAMGKKRMILGAYIVNLFRHRLRAARQRGLVQRGD